MDIYVINGEFVPEDKACVDVHDLAVLRGYGVFDFLRTYNKEPFHLRDHLERLHRSAKLLDMEYQIPVEELESQVFQALERSPHKECNIRIVITGGVSKDNIMPSGNPQTIIIVSELKKMNLEYYSDGVKVVTSQVDRFLPGAKSLNYIPAIMGLKEAKSRDAIEAIFKDRAGFLLEGTTSNLFAVINGSLVTPPEERILPGITRQVILGFSNQLGPVSVRNIHYDEVRIMEEAFITASNKEVIPVTQINSMLIGSGDVGPVTKEIMTLFAEYAQSFKN